MQNNGSQTSECSRNTREGPVPEFLNQQVWDQAQTSIKLPGEADPAGWDHTSGADLDRPGH